jgi:hypothetical protein
MMFDPSWDPLEQLTTLRQENLQLRNNQMQLAKAFNEQGETVKQLVNVANNMHEEILNLNSRLQLIELARQHEKN